MRSYLRIQSPWAQLALFFGLLGAALVFTSFIIAFILVIKGFNITDINSLDFNNPHIVGILKLLQGISTITIFLLPGLVFAFIVFRYNQLYFFGFHKPAKNNFFILALLIMFVSVP